MKTKFLFLSLLFISLTSLHAVNDSILFDKDNSPHLAVNNRILAKVNDKAISVVDVMKKMDVLFYREFPQYTSSMQARYQFYKANWKHVLEELVSKELVMADAEENKRQAAVTSDRKWNPFLARTSSAILTKLGSLMTKRKRLCKATSPFDA